MTQENRSSRQPDLEMIQVRRNPYLVDYRTGKNIVRHVGRRVGQPQDRQTGRYADQSRSNHTGGRTGRSQHSISAMPQEGITSAVFDDSTAEKQGLAAGAGSSGQCI